MEEGSLLYEALHRNDGCGGETKRLENALILDVYLLDSSSASAPQRDEHLQALAKIGVSLNAHFQNTNTNKQYPWMSGGDGPVFGIHCSRSSSTDSDDDEADGVRRAVAHLRAVCRYGPSVADEWMAIKLLLDYSGDHDTGGNDIIVMECWDVDDGQILLIEAADQLPDWVDRLGPERCRHRCWICNHKIHLIPPSEDGITKTESSSSLSLTKAIQKLQANNNNETVVLPQVQQAIRRAIDRHVPTASPLYQQAAVAVPRSVARLLHNRPDLVSTACQAFVDQCTNAEDNPQQQHPRDEDSYLAGKCEDWVWSTVRFGRTAYAMLRTVVSAPDWKTEESIHPAFLNSSIEVKRLKRQCAVEATPHSKHGLQLGVRLVAGLDHCLVTTASTRQQDQASLSYTERHVLLHWSRVAAECSEKKDDNWITRAWQAGPNQAQHCLDDILKCPVFDPEVQDSLTPLSHPETTLAQQIRTELFRNDDHDDCYFGSTPPHPDQVDSEEWMWMPQELSSSSSSTQRQESTTDPTTTAGLDNLLTGVQTFLTGTSSVEGVATEVTRTKDDENSPMQINPTVFLNILHTALESKSAEELSSRLAQASPTTTTTADPFFSSEDYDLMEPDDDDDNMSDDESGDDDENPNMQDIMMAMDDELKSSSLSRAPDHEGRAPGAGDNDDEKEERIAQDAHVLSNLLQSLDAGAGGPGPIQNILKEMEHQQQSPASKDDTKTERK